MNTTKLILLILALFLSIKVFSQNAEINGLILDANDFPIENVNIISNSSGTVSNSNGFYSINVNSNQDINVEFTHINFKNISLKFNLNDNFMGDHETIVAVWDSFVDITHHLVLPTITLSLFYLALYTRLMRASMLEQYGQDYVVTARAKGLPERRITFGHVLRNALLPVVTMAGVQVGALIGGSVIVESVFAWPGLGMLAFESLFARDLNLLLGIFLISSVLVVVVNLIVDIIYCFLDPRIEIS